MTSEDEAVVVVDGVSLSLAEPIRGDSTTTPTRYDVRVQKRAYELFLTTPKDWTEIAVELEIPVTTVVAWSKAGNWIQRRHEILTELLRSTESQCAKELMAQKLPELREQLEIGRRLEQEVKTQLEAKPGELKTVELRRLAEVFAQATAVTCRALSLLEQSSGVPARGDAPESDSPEGRRAAKTPLVMINLVPGVPPGQFKDEYRP
jgi:hypothetical protein